MPQQLPINGALKLIFKLETLIVALEVNGRSCGLAAFAGYLLDMQGVVDYVMQLEWQEEALPKVDVDVPYNQLMMWCI